MSKACNRYMRALLLPFALGLASWSFAQTSPREEAAKFDIDLSGTHIRVSSSLYSPLLMPQDYTIAMLRAWGAEVEVVTLTTTTGMQALLDGRSDLAAHGADELILGTARGAELLGIGSPQSKVSYVLAATEEVASLEDLEGRTIGISGPEGFDALLSRLALQRAGLDPDTDVRFVQIGGSPERASSLLSGRIDATTIGLDDWFELKNRTRGVRRLADMSKVVPTVTAEVYFGTREYIEANPELALAVACGNLAANRWATADKAGFLTYAVERVINIDPESVEQLYGAAEEAGMWPTEPQEVLSSAGLQELAGVMQHLGSIPRSVRMDEHIDVSYLERAAKLGCGK